MKVNNNDIDKVLNKLIASTRSPRGRFTAENSWKLLEKQLFARRNRRLLWMRVASAAAVVLLCMAGWLAYDAWRPAPMLMVSTLAETRTVVLPDQTKVTLNRYSTLSYPERFKEKRRKVHLQGEAYFEVAKNAKHPFIVKAEAVRVKVLGTHFNVEAYPGDAEVRTTLLEGSVAVSLKGENQRLVLAPNESAVYNKEKRTLVQEAAPGAKNEILWRKGIILFDQLPLHEIVRQLSNAFQTDIRIDDPQLQNYRMTATFDTSEDLTQILDLLKNAGNFNYKKENNTITLTTKLN